MSGLPSSLLFACSQNSVRSPMAEGLLKHLHGRRIYVDSVGVRANPVDPFVVAVMDEKRPDRPFEVKFVQSELNLGIALPQGEDALKSWLNEWVKTNVANGRLTTMFRRASSIFNTSH